MSLVVGFGAGQAVGRHIALQTRWKSTWRRATSRIVSA
jgi:hypothetical protein